MIMPDPNAIPVWPDPELPHLLDLTPQPPAVGVDLAEPGRDITALTLRVAHDRADTMVWMREAMDQAVTAFNAFGAALTESIREALGYYKDVRWLAEILAANGWSVEYESRQRRYAAWYNARHPGRRVSWRRLTRTQRAELSDLMRKGLL